MVINRERLCKYGRDPNPPFHCHTKKYTKPKKDKKPCLYGKRKSGRCRKTPCRFYTPEDGQQCPRKQKQTLDQMETSNVAPRLHIVNSSPNAQDKKDDDLFRVFRPLMRPLSGVKYMTMLTKGDQKIFFIGEVHQKNYCTEKGFTPISRYIEGYLRTADNVDFMIEAGKDIGDDEKPDMNDPNYIERLEKIRKTTRKNKNETSVSSPKRIIINTRSLVSRFIEPQKDALHKYERDKTLKNRVHYIENEHVINKKEENDWFLSMFYVYKTENLTAKPQETQIETLERFINPYIIEELQRHDYGLSSLPWMKENGEIILDEFEKSSKESKKICIQACIELLKLTKFYRKCFRKDQRHVDAAIYVDVLMDHIDKNNIFTFYFDIQRFFMDIYTTCRILKTHTHPTWFKNVVVYAGNWHVQNQTDIFKRLGYTQHVVQDLPFNPYCEDDGPRIVK